MKRMGPIQCTISVTLLEHRAHLFVTFFTLLTRMAAVTPSFVQPGQESNVQTGQSTEGEDELEASDIAAIVLGVLLFLLIIATVVVCILIKKGRICKKEENKKVTPSGLLNGFSTTSGRYMYDDVYHPPNSRPLPNNKVKAEPYDAVAERTVSSKRSTPRYHSYCPRHHKRSRANTKLKKDNTNGAPTPPPTPEPGGAIFQNGGTINITTSGRSPYVDRKSYRY